MEVKLENIAFTDCTNIKMIDEIELRIRQISRAIPLEFVNKLTQKEGQRLVQLTVSSIIIN